MVFGRKMGRLILVGAACVWALTDSAPKPTDSQHAVGKGYSHADLHKMAKGKGMAQVGAFLTDKYEFVASPLGVNLPLDVEEDAEKAQTRKAVLLAADLRNDKDLLGGFAKADNAARTCSTIDTAGGYGLEVCVAQCDRKSGFLQSKPALGACYALCSVAVEPCSRLPPGIEWDTHGVEALTVFVSEIPIGLYLHKTLAFIASVGIAGASGTKSVVAAFVEGDDHARVAYIVLFLGVVGIVWKVNAITRKAWREAREANRRADELKQANAALKLKSLLSIRKKVLLHGAFDDIHLAGAGSGNINHSRQPDTVHDNKGEACKILERLTYQHERRWKAVKFTQWKGAMVAFSAVDKALGRKCAPCAER